MASKEKVGELIKARRMARGWTQEELAEKLQISASAIGMYESGRRYPKPDIIEALADVFNVPKWAIIMTEDEVQPRFPANVRPISALHAQRIPLIGEVAAGEPIYAPEELGVYVESPVDADAAITIHGDSMEPTYKDGDLVYIKCRPDVPEGTVAVVFLDDEATLKHVYKRPTGLTLLSDNMATHPPIMVEFEDYANVRIFGVPVGFTRMYRQTPKLKIRKDKK